MSGLVLASWKPRLDSTRFISAGIREQHCILSEDSQCCSLKEMINEDIPSVTRDMSHRVWPRSTIDSMSTLPMVDTLE